MIRRSESNKVRDGADKKTTKTDELEALPKVLSEDADHRRGACSVR